MWSTVELGRGVTGSGEMRCHGDLVLVAVEILMKAGGLVSGTSGPQRDRQHPALRALRTEVIMCRGTATSWVCVCDWIHMCSSSSNKAVHLQCDSMFSDHGRTWVQGGRPSDASAAARRNFKHLRRQCVSLLQRSYSPQRCVCVCLCVGLSTSECTWNLFLKLSRGAQWLVVTHFHFLQQAQAQQLEICCLRTIRHPCKTTAKSSILFSHTYSSFPLFSF